MGASCKGGKINWLALVICGGSFLRYMLSKFGYALDEGLVVIADDVVQARSFVAEYCQKSESNGRRIASWKQRRTYPANYCCGFLMLKNTMKEEEVIEFLSEQDFLPIVISGGIIPEYLKCDHYIFRLRGTDLENVCGEEFAKEIATFCRYIIENVAEVCKTLENLQSCIMMTEYKGSKMEKKVYSFFAGIGSIYAAYLRSYCSEIEVLVFLDAFMRETNQRLRQIKEFSSGEELSEMISSLVWGYFENHKDIFISSCKEVCGNVYQALKLQNAVLYDDKYYFFPTGLFAEICESLLQTSSGPELKRQLKEEGILYCNSRDYTVKKEFITVYGIKERMRMLWVHKEYLLSPEYLYLEDMFENRTKKEEKIGGQ